MNDLTRRSFASRTFAGIAAFGMASTLDKPAEAQLVWSTSEWNLGSFEGLLHEKATVKQLFDITKVEDGAALAKVKNSLDGLHYGFGVPVDQIKVIGGLHGPANLLAYDDYVWEKYQIGAWLEVNDPRTRQPAVKNPYYFSKLTDDAAHITAATDPSAETSPLQDASMQGLQRRGVRFLSCHTALEEQVRQLIKHYTLSGAPETIARDMLAHTVPGVLVVASMVSAIALLQCQGGYSYVVV
jgi:intracellular sulfur oxidation DsrE/DsrF family protein